jgi:hypothetical protein
MFKAVTNYGCHFTRYSLVRLCRRLYRWSSSSDRTKAKARQVACHVNVIHCAIHSEESASRDLQPELRGVLQMAVKVLTL